MNSDIDSSTGRRCLACLPLFFYGVIFSCFGFAMYLFGVVMVLPRRLLDLNQMLLPLNEWIVWYSGVLVITGLLLALADLCFLLKFKRRHGGVRSDPLKNRFMTVALTA